ncbi:hypothetical protein [Roseofilum casamattae]|uniref:Uncharacterized protein n=1 Tax=Roseofilum casamattae BLCC-M143 TaxID=3022442 RepID=A0ABT7BV23_9CYAN|nr:hypothetical protein [Roseofilum casamattae]MDJ1182647.1 hypothetical protein [Roseofilum casamattae BLCC-M143]
MLSIDNQQQPIQETMLTQYDREKLEEVGQKFRAAQAPYHMMVESLLNPDTTLLYMACLRDDGRITPDERSLLDWFKQFTSSIEQLSDPDRRELINCAFHGYYACNDPLSNRVQLESEEIDESVNDASVA